MKEVMDRRADGWMVGWTGGGDDGQTDIWMVGWRPANQKEGKGGPEAYEEPATEEYWAADKSHQSSGFRVRDHVRGR